MGNLQLIINGETKSDLVRELALNCRRQGRLAELEERVWEERPFLPHRI
jgi:hypothetical protein